MHDQKEKHIFAVNDLNTKQMHFRTGIYRTNEIHIERNSYRTKFIHSFMYIFAQSSMQNSEGGGTLEVRAANDGTVTVTNLKLTPVNSASCVERLMATGSAKRHTHATLMNAGSSRSHLVLTIYTSCNFPHSARARTPNRLRTAVPVVVRPELLKN